MTLTAISEQISDRILDALSESEIVDPEASLEALLYIVAGIIALRPGGDPVESVKKFAGDLLVLVTNADDADATVIVQ